MEPLSDYQEYAELAIESFAKKNTELRYLLVDSVKHLKIESVLDVGCGAGQELLPFVETTKAIGVGIDIGEELGKIATDLAKIYEQEKRMHFCRSEGEHLPFADQCFDLVLCQVALPYMNNKKTLAEISRVLRPKGVFLLKTHAPLFYLNMIGDRARTLSPRQVAYPIICLAAGVWHHFTGKQLRNGFWAGKGIFQTKNFLVREFDKHGMKIEGTLSDNNIQTPSFFVVKN